MRLYIIATLLLMVSMGANAHQWNGDKWANNQIDVMMNLKKCIDVIEEPAYIFLAECNIAKIMPKAIVLFEEFSAAIETHPGNQLVQEFAELQFTDVEQGILAIRTIKLLPKIVADINKKQKTVLRELRYA